MSPPRQRKRLGQHWLIDPELRDAVVANAEIVASDEVLEIGAGPGTLTPSLVRLARRVVAVEVDPRILPTLRAAAPGAEIVEGDILRLDLSRWFPAGGEIVVGNIPYYLSGALIARLLETPPRPRRLSFVVQREVAERWCGIGGWSLSTVVAQTLSEPRIVLELPPEAFDPPPRVFSAQVVLDIRDRPAVTVPDLNAFFRFAEQLFQQRRKQLGGTLSRVWSEPRPTVDARLSGLGIDPMRRPETLSLAEWERLHEAARQR